jgi:hypothetical protein
MTTLSDKPADDTIEVSLFGPGYGESCLIHFTGGDWMIVDSCLDQRSGQNPTLAYLDRIGVAADSAVRLVVASHAHDDHIAGLADIVEKCTTAEFVCSVALTKSEFFALLEADEMLSDVMRQSSYKEFRAINDVLQARATGRRRWPAYTWAIADRPIYVRQTGTERAIRVTALSPSDEAVTRALAYFAELRPVAGSEPGRVASADPNTLTAALWVEIGDSRVLLGGDLLAGPGQGCGWNAIMSSDFRPQERAEVFKVPHHGAPNAHHAGVWAEMLIDNPIALLTPFRRLKRPRPTPSDTSRICSLTDRAYITAQARRPSQPAAIRRTAAQLSRIAREVREPEGSAGHIRARLAHGSDRWTIDLADPALPLCPRARRS